MRRNEEIAAKLRTLGKLCELAGENPFKHRAYNNAAERLETLKDDISAMADPTALTGIGASIGDKIIDIIDTGTTKKLDDLLVEYGGMLAILEVPGIGPKTAQKLFHQGTRNIDQLKELVASGKITDARIVEGIKQGNKERRIPIEHAKAVADVAIKRVHETMASRGVTDYQVSTAGSLRRGKATIGDVDLIICSSSYGAAIIAAKAALDVVVEEGTSKISGTVSTVHTDVRVVEPATYGAMLLYFTGSKMLNIGMRKKAMERGWILNEYGLWDGTGHRLASKTEQEIFHALDMEYLEPKDREIE